MLRNHTLFFYHTLFAGFLQLLLTFSSAVYNMKTIIIFRLKEALDAIQHQTAPGGAPLPGGRGETACTAAELAEDLRREGLPGGPGHHLPPAGKLEAAGAVHKVNTEEGALYQYCGRQSQGHRDCFLLKCERCGRIRHVDCTHLQNLYDHLEREHHFRIDPRGRCFPGCATSAPERRDHHGAQ